jgi:hypothetical protein
MKMANKSIKYIIGIFVLAILSTSIYIMLPGKVRLDVAPTNTKFSVFENNKFVLAATEYVYLYDGTSKMRALSREIAYSNASGIIQITRKVNYKDSISTFETYAFNSTQSEIASIPIAHETDCINCVGKILQFEYTGILYEGATKDITTPFSFGHNMKVAWQNGAYYAKVFQQTSDKIVIKYKPAQDYEAFNVRLFDPVFLNKELVSDVCVPVYKTWTVETPIYIDCMTECAPENLSCVPYSTLCLDHIDTIEHVNEQVGCTKIGQVDVAGKTIAYDGYWCELDGDYITCVSYREGGQWNSCKPDGSVTCFKINLNTGEETYYSSPGINIGKVINFEST